MNSILGLLAIIQYLRGKVVMFSIVPLRHRTTHRAWQALQTDRIIVNPSQYIS